MNTKYKFIDNNGMYFVRFATVSWVDVSTRLPVVAGIVSEPHHYVYSSERDYLGINGVLDVEILERPMSLGAYVFSS